MSYVLHGRDDREPRKKLKKAELVQKVEDWAKRGWSPSAITSILRDVGENRQRYQVKQGDVERIVIDYRKRSGVYDLYFDRPPEYSLDEID